MYRTPKIALSALAAAVLLATGSAGDAAGQTRQKQIEMKPVVPQLQKKPAKPSRGPVKPGGPGSLGTQPPTALPDFILEPGLPGNVSLGLPNSGFCKRIAAFGAADRVAFKVRFATNGTQAPANGWGASLATISFNNGPSANILLPSPSWSGTVAHEVNIPNGCYGAGGCQFTITIDPANVVPETSNANNSITTICAAPAG